MGKVYSKLVESFGYLTEAPVNDTGYDPDKVQYAYQDGKANPNWPGNKPPAGPDTSDYTDPRGTDNVTNDPNKPVDPNKKKPGGSGKNAGTRAFQHWLNSKGIKVSVDGVWGPETAAGNDKYFNTYVYGKKMPREQQDEYEAMRGVGTAYNVRVTPGSGNMYIGSPEYLAAMKKYGYDPKTGNPVGGATPGQSGQPGRATGALPSKQEALILKSLERLEPIFKKYGVKVECAYKEDGTLLTEDDWVLKHINMFTPEEQMQIWKVLSEAVNESEKLDEKFVNGKFYPDSALDTKPKRSVTGNVDLPKDFGKAPVDSKGNPVRPNYLGPETKPGAGAAPSAPGASAAPNVPGEAPAQQSKLSKFGKNLAGRFGLGGGKRALAKGAAKLGLRAIPFIGTAYMLWDIGSALYDTFATTEMADIDPADQQIIAQEIQNLTQMSKSADYNSVSDETKKRVTAILNAANKLAQQQAA